MTSTNYICQLYLQIRSNSQVLSVNLNISFWGDVIQPITVDVQLCTTLKCRECVHCTVVHSRTAVLAPLPLPQFPSLLHPRSSPLKLSHLKKNSLLAWLPPSCHPHFSSLRRKCCLRSVVCTHNLRCFSPVLYQVHLTQITLASEHSLLGFYDCCLVFLPSRPAASQFHVLVLLPPRLHSTLCWKILPLHWRCSDFYLQRGPSQQHLHHCHSLRSGLSASTLASLQGTASILTVVSIHWREISFHFSLHLPPTLPLVPSAVAHLSLSCSWNGLILFLLQDFSACCSLFLKSASPGIYRYLHGLPLHSNITS